MSGGDARPLAQVDVYTFVQGRKSNPFSLLTTSDVQNT